MSGGKWIDKELSSELPSLCGGGEGQHIEFKERYPKNGSDLSKEIAAFASSNPGRIIIGVADDGTLVGVEDLKTPTGRDKLCRRIEGLCTNNVKPAITPMIKFAHEDGKSVLVIEVPRGEQPIYYSDNKPYVRHFSQSRPAEPNEVIERVTEWSKSSPLAPSEEASAEEVAQSNFISTLAVALVDVLIFGNELEGRNVNPWLDELRFQLGATGKTLRELAAEDVALEMGLDDQLREIADHLDRVEGHRLTMGGDSWAELERQIAEAVKCAHKVKAEQIDTAPLSEDSANHLQDVIRTNARQLADLDRRAARMIDEARSEEVQSDASEIGYVLLRVSHFRLKDQSDGFAEELRAIGQDLHLMETVRLYMDGGQSMQRILDRLHELHERMQALILAGD